MDKENKIALLFFLASVMVMIMVFVSFIPYMIESQRLEEERKEILAGEPTHEGIVISVIHSAGGFGTSDITSVELENDSFAIHGIHSFKIGTYYKFWIQKNTFIDEYELLKCVGEE